VVRWLVILLGLVLLVVGVAACDTDDADDASEPVAEDVPATPTPPATPRPNVTVVQFIPVTATYTPSVTPTPTITQTPLPFPIENFIGSWTVTINYDFGDAPGIEGINVWSYSAGITLEVNATGLVIGRGSFSSLANDDQCVVTVLDDDDLDFFVAGQIRQDGDTTFFDLSVEPDDLEATTRYRVACIDDAEPREVELNYLWPSITAAELIDFSFAVSEGERIITRVGQPGEDDETGQNIGARLELLR
jgi:hypothetical protein